MVEIYKAMLRGNQLEWSGDAPQELDPNQAVEIYVTIAPQTSRPVSDGKAMAGALAKLAASGSISKITDPLAWQRQQRQERPLPGRDR